MEGLASRTQLECRKIGEKYKEMYGEELVHLLENRTRSHKDETRISGEACAGLCMLVVNPHERDAITAKEALDQQSGVNYKALIEVFVGRKSSHIVLIQQAYQKKFKRQLDHDIISIEPSHPYKRVSLSCQKPKNKFLFFDINFDVILPNSVADTDGIGCITQISPCRCESTHCEV